MFATRCLDYGADVHAAQPPPTPGTPESKPAGLVVLVVVSATIRLFPLVMLAFLTLFAWGSTGDSVADYEHVETSVALGMTAALFVGTTLVVAEFVLVLKKRFSALTIVSGLIALADVGSLIWLIVDGDRDGGAALNVGIAIAVVLFVQAVITALSAREAARSGGSASLDEMSRYVA